MPPIITAENLGKKYQLGARKVGGSLRETISELFQSKENTKVAEFWALQDVTFEVEQGTTLGIIGRNGAGKSTLLKILSRVVSPTTGKAVMRGRVASLLEVGTGFHQELTGRENIFLNGSILGMSRQELITKFDEIVEFSGIEKFIDTQVKRYSSGMYVRLAFAVAAHLDPEIMIVDEVLAVGDAEFQKRCLGKMEQVSKTSGRTVIFVSHNMFAIKKLCQKAILLEKGKIVYSGDSNSVADRYLEGGVSGGAGFAEWSLDNAPGNETTRITKIEAIGSAQIENRASLEEEVTLSVEFVILKACQKVHIAVHVSNSEEVLIFETGSTLESDWNATKPQPGVYRSICRIPGNLLNDGQYFFSVLLIENGSYCVAKLDRVVSIEIVEEANRPGSWMGKWGGVIRPKLDWSTRLVDNASMCN